VEPVTIDPFTQAHDAVASALAQLDAAWPRRQQSPELLRQALDNFHAASKALAKLVQEREGTA
jgi:hypothetical protein